MDNSPEMLLQVRGARTVCADIEGLNLGRTFPVVLLASHLINTAHPRQPQAFDDASEEALTRSRLRLKRWVDERRTWGLAPKCFASDRGVAE